MGHTAALGSFVSSLSFVLSEKFDVAPGAAHLLCLDNDKFLLDDGIMCGALTECGGLGCSLLERFSVSLRSCDYLVNSLRSCDYLVNSLRRVRLGQGRPNGRPTPVT